MPDPLTIDIVICTYNRAEALDHVLGALASQAIAKGVAWSVLVVDNACTDRTWEVVQSHQSRSRLPGLRRIVEPRQGLTHARQRGVHETSGDWIAFVDDDNLLEPDWISAIADAIRAHPEAGGIGGRVVLDWEQPPPAFLDGFGFCFAEQDRGAQTTVVDNLAGAGMVLRRTALVGCGWVERPLLADRIGKKLVSGGDVEIAQRIRGCGYPLWFTPHAVLRHRIPASRTTRRYFLKVNAALGASEALVGALTWPGDHDSWRRESWSTARRKAAWAAEEVGRALRRRGLTPALGWTAQAVGFLNGLKTIALMDSEHRSAVFGAANGTRRPDDRAGAL